jgi:hypothetical protein
MSMTVAVRRALRLNRASRTASVISLSTIPGTPWL